MNFIVQPLAGYPNVYALYCVVQEAPAPIGFIWYRHSLLGIIELLYVFVHEDHRKKGVATNMLNWLKQVLPGMTIAGAKVNEMSRGWCLKNGFVETKNGWFFYPNKN